MKVLVRGGLEWEQGPAFGDDEWSSRPSTSPKADLTMITYETVLYVPEQTLATLTDWITLYCTVVDSRPWRRAASPSQRALLVLA